MSVPHSPAVRGSPPKCGRNLRKQNPPSPPFRYRTKTLENTNRFLSQAGDYAMYLSKKSASGQELSEEERSQFASLREYADRLSGQLDEIATGLQNGTLTLEQLSTPKTTVDDPENPGTTSHMQQIEDSFMGYPTLIYDGPFSDHILDKTPLMTEGKAEVPGRPGKAAFANQVAAKI